MHMRFKEFINVTKLNLPKVFFVQVTELTRNQIKQIFQTINLMNIKDTIMINNRTLDFMAMSQRHFQ